VHGLESQPLSIQGILIADGTLGSRKLTPTAEQKRHWGQDVPRFLVAMRAEPDVIALATALLRRNDPSYAP